MNKHVTKALLGTSAAALFLGTVGCGEDEAPSNESILIGDWSVYLDEEGEEVSGPVRSDQEEPEVTYGYRMVFAFEADGAFEQCYRYDQSVEYPDGYFDDRRQDAGIRNTYERCFVSEWEWVDENELIIGILEPEFLFNGPNGKKMRTEGNSGGFVSIESLEIDLSELSETALIGEVIITGDYYLYNTQTYQYELVEDYSYVAGSFEAYPVGSDEDLAKQQERQDEIND